jgi:RNA polymerase sigma-70 factor (ECF subfamily)
MTQSPNVTTDDVPFHDEAQHDLALLERIRHGNSEAFEQLVHRHTPTLLRLARSITGSLDMAEDVVQSVFMRLWLRRADLGIRSDLRRYLWTSVRNEARQVVRHQKVEDRFATAARDGVLHLPRSVSNAAPANLAAEELVALVVRLLMGLPARCRTIFLLAWRDGLTPAEIAEFYEISPRTVQNQIARAVRHLAQSLGP